MIVISKNDIEKYENEFQTSSSTEQTNSATTLNQNTDQDNTTNQNSTRNQNNTNQNNSSSTTELSDISIYLDGIDDDSHTSQENTPVITTDVIYNLLLELKNDLKNQKEKIEKLQESIEKKRTKSEEEPKRKKMKIEKDHDFGTLIWCALQKSKEQLFSANNGFLCLKTKLIVKFIIYILSAKENEL